MAEIAHEIGDYTRAEVGLNGGNTKKKAALDTSAAKSLGRKRP
jgi:hypothetical protein